MCQTQADSVRGDLSAESGLRGEGSAGVEAGVAGRVCSGGRGWPSCSFTLCLPHRRRLHHDRALPVESVGHHRGQLPAALHPQVLEAQALSPQLLQAELLRAWQPPEGLPALRTPRLAPAGGGRQGAGAVLSCLCPPGQHGLPLERRLVPSLLLGRIRPSESWQWFPLTSTRVL